MKRKAIAGLAVAGLAFLGIAAASPAAANIPSRIVFVSTEPVVTDFGSDWSIALSVYTDYEGVYPMQSTGGTVDIYLSGIGGIYAPALPIQEGGIVYFAQPTAQPLLPAGTYEVSAVFNSAIGTYVNSGQTATPLSLTISALSVTPKTAVTTDPAASAFPIITGSIEGAYVDAEGGAPAGTWRFDVTDNNGKSIFSSEVPGTQGATEPVQVELTTKLQSGTTFTVKSSFEPVAELAGGLEVAEVPDTTFSTPGTTFVDALASRVPTPYWLLILIAVLLAGLTATVIVLGVKLSHRTPLGSAPKEKAPAGIPGDPEDVELISWEEAGIHDEETKALPTTWSLSAMEPTEAPTELIDSSDAAANDAPPPSDRTGAEPEK